MKKPTEAVRTKEQRQDARRQAVIKDLRIARQIVKDSAEGWRLLGKHLTKDGKKIVKDSAEGWRQLGEHIFGE